MTHIPEEQILDTGKQAAIGCIEACQQGIHLVSSIDQESYIATPEGSSSIGTHMRHCVEHFQEFMNGFEKGEVHYDARERNMALEVSRELFQQKSQEFLDFLEGLSSEDLSKDLMVFLTPCSGNSPKPMVSNTTRELAFLSCHTIHHIALTMVLAKLLKIQIPEDLGVAYATQNHRANIAAG